MQVKDLRCSRIRRESGILVLGFCSGRNKVRMLQPTCVRVSKALCLIFAELLVPISRANVLFVCFAAQIDHGRNRLAIESGVII